MNSQSDVRGVASLCIEQLNHGESKQRNPPLRLAQLLKTMNFRPRKFMLEAIITVKKYPTKVEDRFNEWRETHHWRATARLPLVR